MLSEILKQDLQVGYNLSCQKLQELILYRLYTDPNEIFDDLFKADREPIDKYCKAEGIDLADALMNDGKGDIALGILEPEIHKLLHEKIAKDPLIKELGLKTFVILNGVEKCPWYELFEVPVTAKGWRLATNQLLKECDTTHPGYDKAVRVINKIHEDYIKPGDVTPDIANYHHLMNFQVPEEVKDLFLKPTAS